MKAYLELCRPSQWVKNIFVLIPLIFARKFFDMDMVILSMAALGIFILASSSVYVLNDLIDYPRDRLHPDKKKRPLASGRVSSGGAAFLWVVLTILALGLAYKLSLIFFLVVLGYLLLTISYSFFLKKVIFLDVILIALGFVFRVLAGGVAVNVFVSGWLIVLVFLFTLFLAISKRRQELRNLETKSQPIYEWFRYPVWRFRRPC